MSYTLVYSQIWGHLSYLLAGARLSLQLAAISFVTGAAIGLLNALVLRHATGAARLPVVAYVTFFINTPLLVQVFFLFFVLPDMGVLLSPYAEVGIGMSRNTGAYLTEIMRAGLASLRRTEMDAAAAMNFSGLQTLWLVVLPHIVKALYPALSNQFMMTTSIAAIFAVEELTGRAYNVNSLTFRSFEVFSIVAVIYVGLTLVCSLALALLGRWLFRVKARIV